ncbi:S-layer homology domain-containing protein [Paenibacillus hexagrammi]|uniref:S-layer homology domain-containing protein n=1 Tax=Paenibacillus hexagrammi TaxID=2908839 RepID=A0ABY3SFR2_9BACL|nr:S-layer homology domain-containing protein [Paenibacillus sp. YPD9-1]UJF31767.1 S-layer homology domain-containing protein [Paenibacillus sp. YPD9-1]
MYRKVSAILLSFSLVIPTFSSAAPVLAASAEETPSSVVATFADMNGHWANDAVVKFAQAHIVTGYDDQKFHPNEPVTRAEFVTFLNRVFRFAGNGTSSFSDVKPSDWYMDSVSKATQAGLIEGYPDGRFLPDEPILRQDAVLLLTRAFQIGSRAQDSISGFHDAVDIDDYAKSAMASLTSEGYVTGDEDHNLHPKRAMTRAETVELLNRMIVWMSPDYGDLKTKEIKGNVIINRPGTALQDMKIDGNLYVTEGVGEGEATFSNITVSGDTFVHGGGTHSVIFHKSNLSRVLLSKKNHLVRLALNENSSADIVEVTDPSIVEVASGATVKELHIGEAAGGSKIVNNGTIGHLKVGAAGVTVNDKPASIEKDGDKNVLVLEAKKESHSGHDYTSGKLTSQMKGDWTYGKFEVRAKLPVTQREIAKELGSSRSYVSRIEKRSLMKLYHEFIRRSDEAGEITIRDL